MKEKIINLLKRYWWILTIVLAMLAIIGILRIIPSNFIWFILAMIFFNIFYWYFISSLLFIPQMPIMALVVYAQENSYKKWVRIFLLPVALTVGIIVGTLIPCSIFGGGLGLVALNFTENVSYPLVYFIIAGFCAFTIAAPSGETNLLGSFLSLFAFLMVILKTSTELIIGDVFSWIYGIFWLISIIIFLIIIGSGLIVGINFIIRKFFIKNKININNIIVSQINYFKGYCIFNIVFVLGAFIFAILLGLFSFKVGIVIPDRVIEIISIILNYIGIFIYCILLYHFYKVSKFLKEEKLLLMNPVLILIITIILTCMYPIITPFFTIIPFIIIWMKCDTYLQLQKILIK